MGLDTTVYSDVKLIREGPCGADDLPDGQVEIYVNPSFVPNAGGLVTGIYSFGAEVRGVSRAYSGHSRRRDHLSLATNGVDCNGFCDAAAEGDERPFRWLINMSDCEGVIGNACCVDLARDFAEHWPTIKAYATRLSRVEGDDLLDWCAGWRDAAIFAGERGAIRFW